MTTTPQEAQQAALDQVNKLMDLRYLESQMEALAKKLEAGQTLTPMEGNILAEIHYRQTAKPTTRTVVEDGKTHEISTHDIEPLLNAIKDRREAFDASPKRAKNGANYLGSIDVHTAANWAKECGAAVGTKEFTAYAKAKFASNEFARFTGKL